MKGLQWWLDKKQADRARQQAQQESMQRLRTLADRGRLFCTSGAVAAAAAAAATGSGGSSCGEPGSASGWGSGAATPPAAPPASGAIGGWPELLLRSSTVSVRDGTEELQEEGDAFEAGDHICWRCGGDRSGGGFGSGLINSAATTVLHRRRQHTQHAYEGSDGGRAPCYCRSGNAAGGCSSTRNASTCGTGELRSGGGGYGRAHSNSSWTWLSRYDSGDAGGANTAGGGALASGRSSGGFLQQQQQQPFRRRSNYSDEFQGSATVAAQQHHQQQYHQQQQQQQQELRGAAGGGMAGGGRQLVRRSASSVSSVGGRSGGGPRHHQYHPMHSAILEQQAQGQVQGGLLRSQRSDGSLVSGGPGSPRHVLGHTSPATITATRQVLAAFNYDYSALHRREYTYIAGHGRYAN
ncbi:hypothetical protein CHLRE_03g213089v5 [Chlamydomonas reinhardtii]|uniref:Uncharacterized protein n=1 Tax=Chlamydomonas reinhardtii TaxID=3055 RepID=A0A2K3DZX5_CHLRE|nr:uncharacterized protein CHLRE_03g213089v5 [Chlamydomonas reinhardtii]PNW86090.1 hypothetical protein CHLRE_03g213089v5 [Chlamydomonas reinhardtii]